MLMKIYNSFKIFYTEMLVWYYKIHGEKLKQDIVHKVNIKYNRRLKRKVSERRLSLKMEKINICTRLQN